MSVDNLLFQRTCVLLLIHYTLGLPLRYFSLYEPIILGWCCLVCWSVLSSLTNPHSDPADSFLVSHAERVFVYAGLPNGTTQNVADYKNVAPFFLDEKFPPDWFRRGVPFTLAQAFMQAGLMFAANPRELGGNEGLGNFIPLGGDLSTKTPAQAGCFILENIFDLAPGQFQPAIANHLDLFQGFVQGVIAPFFHNDGFFNCDTSNFTRPSVSAGNDHGAQSSSGSPVNGSYPGIGVIKPDSQPS